MENKSIHYEPVGPYEGNIYFDEHPDPAAREMTDQMHQEHETQVREFQDFVDTAPNVNEKYTSELDIVTEAFASDNLEIAPVVVLANEEFEQARELAGSENSPEEPYGFYWFGRAIVKEPDPATQQTYGNDYVLGKALHEAAHSTAYTAELPDSLVVSRNVDVTDTAAQSDGVRSYSRQPLGVDMLGGFAKYKLELDGTIRHEGHFMEEAFADLMRVRALERLGREPRADGLRGAAKKGILHLGRDGKISAREIPGETVVLPVKFANGIKVEGNSWQEASFSTPGIAAYGLELLDKQAPGLFDQMSAARSAPKAYAEAIKMIDDIKPGLYRELRKLTYTAEDFTQGLELIQGAVAEKKAAERDPSRVRRLAFWMKRLVQVRLPGKA